MRLALADETHDAGLRAVAAGEPMPGWVRLRFLRTPSFFGGIAVQGRENQVAALFDGEEIVGTGCRSLRTLFVNGRAREFGYLSGLRLKPRVRFGTALGRGYRFLRGLHGDGRTPGYLTTIVEDNRVAIDLLTSGRAGLPVYLPCGCYHSYAIPLIGRYRGRTGATTVMPGSAIGADALAAFLTREGPRKQFFPVFDAADLSRPHLRGLNLADFRVAVHGDTILGAMAVWDQRRFRQTVVAGYAPFLGAVRPFLNIPLRLAGYRALPPPGRELNIGYLAFVCVRDNAPSVFAALLDAVRTEFSKSDLHFLCTGLHEADALNAVPARGRHLRYSSRLYVVCWPDTRDECEALVRDRVPYLEVATL